eukprot:TRINITY_DN7584_c0_g1_i1.p1 TRINITY_DN7584_c0_g1~~TRINITY_DN7584_c0_g1_i1.p1  ORF type:complete len:353 (-),score=55.82 TRINITY_DN7584_c0_g1_i1:16-1074(-)
MCIRDRYGTSRQELGKDMATTQPNLLEVLETTQVHKLLHKKKIIYAIEDALLPDVMNLLSKENILSVPIRTQDSQDYIGIVDVLDILVFILAIYSKSEKKGEEVQWASWSSDIFELHYYKSSQLRHTKIKDVVDYSSKDPLTIVSPHGTLSQLIELFSSGVHRVPVVDDNVHPIVSNIISQSDVVKFICDNIEALADNKANATVKDLNLGTRNIITMSINAQAIHAFYLMYYNKVNAVGLTDVNSGELIANISASDIKGLTPRHFEYLTLPVLEFMSKKDGLGITKAWDIKREGPLTFPPITCTLNSTFGTVVRKLAVFRLHRVWIVDEHNAAIGVITLTNVLDQMKKWIGP